MERRELGEQSHQWQEELMLDGDMPADPEP